MEPASNVYEQTYQGYLEQVGQVDFPAAAARLGGEVQGDEMTIPILGHPFLISPRGITDQSGRQPSFDLCVVLSKYLLLCPENPPSDRDWVTFRGLRNSGPLTVYFASEVEQAITRAFSGNLDGLKQGARLLGGYPPDLQVDYDLAVQLEALPKVPMVLLYNGDDDEFPAKCTLLFERRAEAYLDAECLAILGHHLYTSLKRAGAGGSGNPIQ